MPVKKSRGGSVFSWLFLVFIVGSIIANILDDLGIDVIAWLRDLLDSLSG
ncbi:MAG: hypothetical protein HKN49_09200 [Gammaproteobacteria bacterium]|nr:hypothetical protein [Gammaproteobacteria bacterium]